MDMSINEIGSSIGDWFGDASDTVITTSLADIGNGIASWFTPAKPTLTKEQAAKYIISNTENSISEHRDALNALTQEESDEWVKYYQDYYTSHIAATCTIIS